MTYGYVKNQVLKLLNQYTRAGEAVAETYNNQDDYIKRIPSLVNDALMEISTTVRRIPVVVPLSELTHETKGKQVWYEMPDDFFQLQSGGTVRTLDGVTLHTRLYSLLGRTYMLVPDFEDGEYTITYYRYPHLVDDDVTDETELDNTVETHLAIPYYVAGMLAAHDDAFICATLNNAFEDRLAKMAPEITAETLPTRDVYSFMGFRGV